MSRERLSDNPFRFVATKSGRVMIYADDRLARTLKGGEAAGFLAKAEGSSSSELQMLMARTTGQFKFGNERTER